MVATIDNSAIISLPECFHDEQAANFGMKIDQSIRQNSQVILDFIKVQYIDSTGITVLLASNKTAKAAAVELVLRGLNDEVRSFFALTCLDQIFIIQDK